MAMKRKGGGACYIWVPLQQRGQGSDCHAEMMQIGGQKSASSGDYDGTTGTV